MNIDEQAKAEAKKSGVIDFITASMYQPKGYTGNKAPYVTGADIKNATGMMQQQYEYLLKSTNPENTKDPQSFLNLRDGGDTGLAGKPGNTVMTGWVNYPEKLLREGTLLKEIPTVAHKLINDGVVAMAVSGIGGSYTNPSGIADILEPVIEKEQRDHLLLKFFGWHLSGYQYHKAFQELNNLKGKTAINIVSKSGTTTEPAIAARILLSYLQNKGPVFATTDAKEGALRKTVELKGYNPSAYITDSLNKEFYIGSDIGGRYSVLTPVGLLPLAAAGVDINTLVLGAYYAQKNLVPMAIERAAYRYAAYKNGVKNEVLSYNLLEARNFILGQRQLFPESDGKAGKGLWVSEEFYTADAHSNGQYLTDGERICAEVFHFVGKNHFDMNIPASDIKLDKLDVIEEFSKGQISLQQANNRFMAGLWRDHYQSGVPSAAWIFPGYINEFTIGQHIQVNFLAAVLFGLAIGINPVNQPGVQGYKNIAFALLGMLTPEKQKKMLADIKQDFGVDLLAL